MRGVQQRGGSAGVKSVLSTKMKYLRLGQEPEFGAGKFIVILCFGATASSLLWSVEWSEK